MSNKLPKIYVAGHRGMVGSAIIRELENQGQTNVVVQSHAELDLTDQQAVRAFFEAEKPDQVYLAAAKVGGHTCQQHLSSRIYLRQPYDTARKLIDTGRLNSSGWHAKINFKDGLSTAYQDYLTNIEALRK
jgi:nucleoside-diphosphate-sugar epimerase